jgi:hypothetical protein
LKYPNAGHPERSGGGKAGGTQSRDPVEVTGDIAADAAHAGPIGKGGFVGVND